MNLRSLTPAHQRWRGIQQSQGLTFAIYDSFSSNLLARHAVLNAYELSSAFVTKKCLRYRSYILSAADMVQEGCLTLLFSNRDVFYILTSFLFNYFEINQKLVWFGVFRSEIKLL